MSLIREGGSRQIQKDQDHNCRDYISALRDELEAARQRDSGPSGSEAPRGLKTISTHIRSFNEYRGNPLLIVHCGNEKMEIRDLTIEQTKAELRKRIEEFFNKPIGQLMIFRHQEIKDEKRLRQHTIGSKPIHITVLPSKHKIEEGRCLTVNIERLGPNLIMKPRTALFLAPGKRYSPVRMSLWGSYFLSLYSLLGN